MTLPKIVKDGTTLISGNVWGQLVSFAAYIVLGRIYSPADFAVYNIFYSYIEVFVILSTCKYELSVVVADSDSEAAHTARLALRLNTVVSLVLLSAIGIFRLLTPTRPHSLTPATALLIPFMVFFCGTSRVYTFLFNRFKRFGPIATSEVAASTAGVVLKVAMAFSAALHSVGLPLGTVLGKLAGNANYLARLRTLPNREALRTSRRARLGHVARKYRNFPLYVMPKDLMNTFSHNLPFLWLALYFDKPEVGLFGLAVTFCFRPVNIFNNAFEKLLYVRVAERVRTRRGIAADLRRFVLVLNAVALPLFVGVFVFAEPLFTLVFGGRWAGIGYYVRCLVPWSYVVLTATSLSFLSNVFGRQRSEFRFYVVLLVLRVGAVVCGIVRHDFRGAILLFSLSGALTSLALLVWYFLQVRRYENGLE